jgi:hypothetical protein
MTNPEAIMMRTMDIATIFFHGMLVLAFGSIPLPRTGEWPGVTSVFPRSNPLSNVESLTVDTLLFLPERKNVGHAIITILFLQVNLGMACCS